VGGDKLHPYEIILLLIEDVIILAEFLSKEGKLIAKPSGLGEEVQNLLIATFARATK
jgi:hypothetical protein